MSAMPPVASVRTPTRPCRRAIGGAACPRPRPPRAIAPTRAGRRAIAALAAAIVVAGPAVPTSLDAAGAGSDASLPANVPGEPTHELHPARLVYAHGPHTSWGPGRAWWRIDWPEAERHFLAGVARYTAIDVAADSAHVTLLDEALFDHPWLLAQQPGRWALGDEETARLGEYLGRGGFLVVDDFHGPGDWAVFAEAMARALPGRPIVELESEELLDVLYELDTRVQIPGRRHLVAGVAGVEARMPHGPPRWRGIRDAAGRLVVAVNFNMDMGDAWEHADDPVYPVPMTTFAYRVGINYVVYAMTH